MSENMTPHSPQQPFFARCIRGNEALFRQVKPSWQPFFLLRYGEIGLKSSPVRNRFLQVLEKNLLRRFRERGLSPVINREPGRLYIFAGDVHSSAELLRTTPGIVSFSLCLDEKAEMEAMLGTFAALAKRYLENGDSFAVRARRSGNHPFTSQDVAVRAGERILKENKNLKVKLTGPTTSLYVEVRNARSFFYLGIEKGPGGFPVGVAGNVLSFVGPELSPEASLHMMKRGCHVHPVVMSVGADDEDGLHERIGQFEERLNSHHFGISVKVLNSQDGDELLDFMKRKRVQGLVFDHGFEELDGLLAQGGEVENADQKERILESVGVRDAGLLEFCVELPFFFPCLAE